MSEQATDGGYSEAHIEQLRAEIERLQAALHWTAQNCLDHACAKRAMAALGIAREWMLQTRVWELEAEIKRLRADKAELVAALRNADRMQVADIFALIHKMEGK